MELVPNNANWRVPVMPDRSESTPRKLNLLLKTDKGELFEVSCNQAKALCLDLERLRGVDLMVRIWPRSNDPTDWLLEAYTADKSLLSIETQRDGFESTRRWNLALAFCLFALACFTTLRLRSPR